MIYTTAEEQRLVALSRPAAAARGTSPACAARATLRSISCGPRFVGTISVGRGPAAAAFPRRHHPMKGIDRILDVQRQVTRSAPDVPLVIAATATISRAVRWQSRPRTELGGLRGAIVPAAVPPGKALRSRSPKQCRWAGPSTSPIRSTPSRMCRRPVPASSRFRDLSRFVRHRARPWRRGCWLFRVIVPRRIHVREALVMFGAKIGERVLIRPRVRVTYPWNLTMDDYV
jgi:hypothetical protein